ncbi:MAG: PaaI family thioesterase [Pseudomonadota bacterium]
MEMPLARLLEENRWDEIADHFNQLGFVKQLGVRVSFDGPEQPRCELREVEDYHLGGIGQDFINGAVTSAVIDLALGLTGISSASLGYFATKNIHIDFMKPVESDGFYVLSKPTQRVGKNQFCEATIYNWRGEARVFATGLVRVGIRGVRKPR